MVRFIKFYFGVAIAVFIVNVIRFLRCSMYQNIYNSNFYRNTPTKNFDIKPSVVPLLHKGHVDINTPDISIIADIYYRNDFNNAFDSAKGYFKHYALFSLFWFFLAIESLSMFNAVNKISNKITKSILGILQFFASYLVLLYLDTSGIGSKTLTALLGALSRLSELLTELFR